MPKAGGGQNSNRAQDGAPIDHRMVQQGKKEEREEGRWGGAHTNASSPAAAQNPKSKKIKMFGPNKPYDKIVEFTPHFSLQKKFSCNA